MTLDEFQTAFDAMPMTTHLMCGVCGLVGRNGCHHLVENFTPVPITGTPSIGCLLRCLPDVVEVPIDPLTGQYLR